MRTSQLEGFVAGPPSEISTSFKNSRPSMKIASCELSAAIFDKDKKKKAQKLTLCFSQSCMLLSALNWAMTAPPKTKIFCASKRAKNRASKPRHSHFFHFWESPKGNRHTGDTAKTSSAPCSETAETQGTHTGTYLRRKVGVPGFQFSNVSRRENTGEKKGSARLQPGVTVFHCAQGGAGTCTKYHTISCS